MTYRFISVVAALTISAAATANAQGVSGAADYYETDTVGEAISGNFMGNTSNPSGNGNGVLPSLSPGPDIHVEPDGFGTLGSLVNNENANDPVINPVQGFE